MFVECTKASVCKVSRDLNAFCFLCLCNISLQYPFEQARGVHVQFAAALYPVSGSVLAGVLVHHVAAHEHGDERTRREPPLVSLRETASAKTTGQTGWERALTHPIPLPDHPLETFSAATLSDVGKKPTDYIHIHYLRTKTGSRETTSQRKRPFS